MAMGACSECGYFPVAAGARKCTRCGAGNPNPTAADRFVGRGMLLGMLAGAVAVRGAASGSPTAAAAGAGLAGFAVLSLADHPAATTRIAVALFAVLGVLAAEAGRPAQGR